jgi:dGTPase
VQPGRQALEVREAARWPLRHAERRLARTRARRARASVAHGLPARPRPIIHSTAFRRLEYKTQVFVNHEGDYYRTRLTHTVEAAQVTAYARAMLGLNETSPSRRPGARPRAHAVRHAGERTLDRLMSDYGGFEHNAQSLRIVDVLEERYPNFRGLNLSWEVREGIVKHSTRYDRPQVVEFGAESAPCLEAQIVDFADEVAYTAHDVDDGLQSGLIDNDELLTVSVWADAWREATQAAGQAPRRSFAIRPCAGSSTGW